MMALDHVSQDTGIKVEDDDVDNYNKIMAERRSELKVPEAPAMPLQQVSPALAACGGRPGKLAW